MVAGLPHSIDFFGGVLYKYMDFRLVPADC